MPVLRAGPASAVVDTIGGRISSLSVDEVELLVTEASSVINRGLYPMVPYAGRIGHGRFAFAGQEYELPCNLPPHAIHGTVLEAGWTTEREGERHWRGRVSLVNPWPFGGSAVHDVELHPDRLTLRLEVTNDERPMPVTAGWHPWWRRQIGRGGDLVVDVDLDGAQMFERDTAQVPTGRLVEPAPPPWDDCFTALPRPPVLRWPGAFKVNCETTATHWVLFTAPPHALCVEPQTGPPDVVNLGTGYAVVAPGQPLVVEAVWKWSPD